MDSELPFLTISELDIIKAQTVESLNATFPTLLSLEEQGELNPGEGIRYTFWTTHLFTAEFLPDTPLPKRLAVAIDGVLPQFDESNGWLNVVCTELIKNSYEMSADFVRIYFDIDKGILIVEDDFFHEVGEVERILRKLKQERVVTTKENEIGGGGIYNIRRTLRKVSGKLTYQPDITGQRILTLVQWYSK